MTDKQLALLLRQIAGRIRALAVEIEPLIYTGEFIKGKPTLDWEHIMRWKSGAIDVPVIETTTFAAVQRILDLADEAELLHQAEPSPEPAD